MKRSGPVIRMNCARSADGKGLRCGKRIRRQAVKLRNMTGIYLSCNGQMLLLYRQGGRVVTNQWVASAGILSRRS